MCNNCNNTLNQPVTPVLHLHGSSQGPTVPSESHGQFDIISNDEFEQN